MPPQDERLTLVPVDILNGGFSIEGSMVGSPEEIQYTLDFASKHNIKPWIETLDINEENLSKAWKKMEKGDVHYRITMTGYDKYFKNK